MMNTASLSAFNSSVKTKEQIADAAHYVGQGLEKQDKGDFAGAKPFIKQGVDKIKNLVINGTVEDKELVFEYYSLFEKFLQANNNEEENVKKFNDIKEIHDNYFFGKTNSGGENTLKEYFNQFIENTTEENNLILLPYKILGKIGESIEKGAFITQGFFVRKEIWYQTNAKITGLHQKYETYKSISEKIDNLKILFEKNVINLENLDKFCEFIIEVQNTFSKEFPYIKPYNNSEPISTFYKKYLEISNKIKNNLLITKLFSKPDFIDVMLKLINNTKHLINILDNFKIKNEEQKPLKERKKLISKFFFNTILKLTLVDMKELTIRFLNKKILSFEAKEDKNS